MAARPGRIDVVDPRAHEPDLPPGARVGPYEVREIVGRGGQGVVYRAVDTRDGSTIALKVQRASGAVPASDTAEVRALTGIRHEHVVALRGVFEGGGVVALALEFVPGGGLSALLAGEPVGGARVEAYARDLLAGLGAVHAAGVIHRDLKPSNVLVGASGRLKLSDFGIARAERHVEATGPRRVEGSPAYMAPEVILGHAASVRSDLFSLGVVLHRALYGRLPFDGATDAEIWLAILKPGPAVAPDLLTDASAGLLDLIDRCLSKEPVRRPASCAEALDVLAGRAGPPVFTAGRALVGRDEELARLAAYLDELAAGQARVVVLKGAAGAGTSALIEATAERAMQRGVVWIGVTVDAEGFLRPAVRAIVRTLDAERAPRSADVLAARRRLFEAGAVASEVEQPGETVRDIGILLRAIAGSRPLVLAVDAIHEADPDDVRRLEAVVRTVTAGSCGVILGVRSESSAAGALAGLESDDRARSIGVGALSEPHLVEVLERRTGSRLDATVGELVAARALGSIPSAISLLAHLRAVGAVTSRAGTLVGREGWLDDTVLPDARASITAALGRMDAAQRRLVEAAAVDGIELDPVALATVLGWDVRSVLRTVGDLGEAGPGILAVSRGEARFASAAVRDVVLATAEAGTRATDHFAFAGLLASRVVPVDPERLARHYEALEDFARARPCLLRAATEAAWRFERSRFVDLCRRAGVSPDGLAPPVTPEIIELALKQIQVLSVLRRGPEVERLGRVIEGHAADRHDDETSRRVLIRLLHVRVGEHALTRDETEALRSARDLVISVADRTRASYALSRMHNRAGDRAAAIVEGKAAVASAREAGLPGLEAAVEDHVGGVLEARGDVDAAVEAMSRAISLCEAVGASANASISRIKLSLLEFDHERRFPSLLALAGDIDRVRSLGGAIMASKARVELARVLRTSGELGAALTECRRAQDEVERYGYGAGRCLVHAERAAVMLGLGDVDHASREIAAARSLLVHAESIRDVRGVNAVESAIASALGYTGRALAGVEGALPPAALGDTSQDGLIAVLLEGVLVADAADGRAVLEGAPELVRAAEGSRRLVPRALLASARAILDFRPGPQDDAWIDAGLASTFVQNHHLVAAVATKWAYGERCRRRGDVPASEAARACALRLASGAGRTLLSDQMNRRAAR